MAKLTDEQVREQVLLLTRGCEAVYTQQELAQRLQAAGESGRPLRIKLGLDPTKPDIHVGHVVQLRQARKFQDLGHKAVIIIGDYTARIGDPSGANKTRPVLTPEEIEANAQTYFDQVKRVLDVLPRKLEVRYNSEWLAPLSFEQVIRLCAEITVARMMERDTFEIRYKAGVPIGVHELLYPIIQGYDSVCIQADVELGGSDQTFNNLVGRDMQERAGQPRQIVLIFPLLVGLDGVEKMSKSKDNYIGITEAPKEMFGKVMSIPDKLMDNYFTLATELERERIDVLLDEKHTHPRDAKVTLAKEIVRTYHGPQAAEAAAAEFDRVFSQGDVPAEMPEVRVRAGRMNIVELVFAAGFAPSKSEARRLVLQSAVSIDGRKVADPKAEVELKTGAVLRVGKLRFGRITPG